MMRRKFKITFFSLFHPHVISKSNLRRDTFNKIESTYVWCVRETLNFPFRITFYFNKNISWKTDDKILSALMSHVHSFLNLLQIWSSSRCRLVLTLTLPGFH